VISALSGLQLRGLNCDSFYQVKCQSPLNQLMIDKKMLFFIFNTKYISFASNNLLVVFTTLQVSSTHYHLAMINFRRIICSAYRMNSPLSTKFFAYAIVGNQTHS
jgi:hypothetical protein